MKGLAAVVAVAAIVVLCLASCASCQKKRSARPVHVESVVAGLTPLARLDALRVEVSGVVEAVQPPEWVIDRPSRLVLIVRGAALYGVPDLERARVLVSGNRVRVVLPAPVVVESWVDAERTQVWRRHGGVLAGADESLDQAAWSAAAALVLEAAQRADHAEQARRRAEALVESIARQAAPGCEVVVEWLDDDG
ncbi:MAG: DUF4230 domain-containing protein [Phycisphaerales bacterium]